MRGPEVDLTPADRARAKIISREYRMQRGISQEQLAHELGIRMMSISEIERGAPVAPSRAVQKILDLAKAPPKQP